MQFPQPRSSRPLPFFQAFLGEAVALPCVPVQDSVARNRLSEVTLSSGVSGLLASVLRDLSAQDEQRWLCLVGAPAQITHEWLRRAGIHRERVLLMHPTAGQTALELACQALRLGRSHTVVSWLELEGSSRLLLQRAADAGDSQSLNIRLS